MAGTASFRLPAMIPDFGEIQRLVGRGWYEFSIHAQHERLAEDLDVVEVEEAVQNGELLEEYPNDPRGWSCLVLGYTAAKPIHVVLGWAPSRRGDIGVLRIITVYLPRPPRWRDPRTRGGRR
jgi:hypothetical protein